jgi:hypothetical protein
MSELATFCEELERAVNRIEGVAWVEATPETAMIVHVIEDTAGEPRDPLRIEVSFA